MRPYVICHMCTTIDGKILVDRWGPRLAKTQDGKPLFETTASSFGVKSWIVGTRTMREFSAKSGMRLPRSVGSVPTGDFLAEANATQFAIGTDAKGVLRFKKNEVDGDHIVILVTHRASQAYLAHLRARQVSYLLCGARSLDLSVGMTKLRRLLGVRKLMLEGGGTFNGAMLQAGLVDEISQVIVPAVDGGADIPGLFQIEGSGAIAAKLRLIKHRTLPGGMSWLQYKVRGLPGPRHAR